MIRAVIGQIVNSVIIFYLTKKCNSFSYRFLLSSQQTNYCDPKLCPSGEPHIACNGLNKLSTTCGPGAQEVNLAPFQDLILDLHNQLRNRVALGLQNYTRYAFFPQAVRMPTLVRLT